MATKSALLRIAMPVYRSREGQERGEP
eukprot:SAG31_NODE_35078_length_326_cov_1.127753_1_plen_26_part_10